MSELKIVVAGAVGRMGRANISQILKSEGLQLVGAIEHDGSDSLGNDVGEYVGVAPLGIAITSDVEKALSGADALIDFTTPLSSVNLSRLSAQMGLVHVIGTTGCSAEDEAEFITSAQNGARIVRSGNFSMGVNLLATLVKQAAATLDESFDVEVLEMHHNRKIDAPSGTALLLGQAAADGRGISLDDHAVKSREGITGAREQGTIGFATLRGGDVVGDHTVMFVSDNERIELTHRAQNRGLFSAGAVKAAQWAANKPAGFYTMLDVLGLNQGIRD